MKENIMKPRHLSNHNGAVLQGKNSNKRPLIQNTPTSCASQTTGAKPFTGKLFYLDLTSNRVAEMLENDIIDLGGTVEKFFSREIKYLVSNKREAKYVQCLRQDSPVPSPESGPSSPHPCSNSNQPVSHGDGTKSVSQIQKDTFTASRGKSLVKRVVKEQERIQMNKILSNALDWGVKILYLDDVIAYVQKQKKMISNRQQPATSVVKKNVKTESSTKHGFQKSKGGRINKPFIKVEDSSKHYRPFYVSLTNIPEFNLKTLPPCTPFCIEDKDAPGNRPHRQRGGRASATDERANDRKKNKKQGGYCECCLVKYDNITTHLQSERHKIFAKSDEYLVVDKLASTMRCNFIHIKSKIKRPKCGVSAVLIAPGPFGKTKPRHKGDVDTAVIIEEEMQSQHTERREEEDYSGHGPKISSVPAPVVCRTSKRRKRCTLSDTSKHKLKQPCRQNLTSPDEAGQEHVHQLIGELTPSIAERIAAYPDFTSDVQLNLSEQLCPTENKSGALPDVTVQNEPSSASLIETKPESQIKQESSPCATTHSGNLLQEQMTENSVLERDISCEDFLPVQRIQRRIKVYKRKRRKMTTPVVSCELLEPRDAADDGLMRLWELFQASDDMDVEFHGFDD